MIVIVIDLSEDKTNTNQEGYGCLHHHDCLQYIFSLQSPMLLLLQTSSEFKTVEGDLFMTNK